MRQTLRGSVYRCLYLWLGTILTAWIVADEAPGHSLVGLAVTAGLIGTAAIVGVDVVTYFIQRKSHQSRERTVFPPAA